MTLIERAFARDLTDPSALTDAFELMRIEAERDPAARRWNRAVRRKASQGAARGDVRMYELLKRALLFDAQEDFDAFCQYIEWNRDPKKRFYLPRRKQLLPVVGGLQALADDVLDLLAVSLPPGTGKTTLAIFYLCWMAGKRPHLQNLTCSHNNDFLRGVYDECLRIVDAGGEYLWGDVFPDVKLAGTNAKSMRIDFGERKRFETLEFTSKGAGNAGKVRATNLLYCDDLVEGIEQAMSREQMDKLWQIYTDDFRQRKQGSSPKELHIATRWSVHDVIGRLEAALGDDPRARFITIPALNENDESNFDYPYGVGFSTAAYHQQRDIMDDASWRALYMNQPIEREGQLYHPDELRRYFDLPEREPDAVVAVCDTKDRGKDYCVMPIAYQYGTDFYIEEIICDNGNPAVVEERLIDALLRHKVGMARFESNSAGGKIAEKVQLEVKKRGGRTRVTTKFTTANKETKIIIAAGTAKERFLFRNDNVAGKEYRKAMQMLCGYTMAGKNAHDDVPDAVAMLVDLVESFETGKVKVFKRPF